MIRRPMLTIGLLGLMYGMIALAPARAATPRRPNVLFIAVDDLNDWVHCLGGHPDCQTPNIDGLAARGVLFAQAHCAAPACNPSRAALLTGIRPSSSGVYVNPQPWRPAMPEVVTLPQHFMRHGYHVVGGGKIYHGSYPDKRSWHSYFKKTADPKPTAAILKDRHSRAGGVVWGRLDAQDHEMDDYRVVSWAADYLKQTHDRPFFLACGIYRPHMPWQVPRKYYDQFPLDKITLPDVPDDDLNDVPAAGIKMAKPRGDHDTILKTDNWRYAVQAYLASIAFADAQVGRLLAALDASEHRENTIVVLWGDHGWHLGEKHHWRKFSLWEEATRAPLMIAAPGVTQPGGVCRRPIDFMSIYPTLAELCGLPIPQHVEGPSVKRLLENPQAAWQGVALTTHGRLNHAVRDERYRYIRYADQTEELYDHAADPMEWKNIASNPSSSAIIARLRKHLPKTNAPNAAFDTKRRRRKK